MSVMNGVRDVGWRGCGETVSILSGFILRPWNRWCSAVLWRLTLCLAVHLTNECSGCDWGLDVRHRVVLWSRCCRSSGMGRRLVWISTESVGEVLIAPVMTSAAVLWACVIFLAISCEPHSGLLESMQSSSLIQTLAA